MTGIVLLAAGGSTRLGRAKQLVGWRGKPLLLHAAETALASGLGPVVVVLGAAEKECRECLEGINVDVVSNPGWEQGMGGSIASGMRALAGLHGNPGGVLIMLCDQPHVTPALLKALVMHPGGHDVVHSLYRGHPGPPVWFSAKHFPALALLHGDSGARDIIRAEENRAAIDAPEAGVDVDTEEDVRRLG